MIETLSVKIANHLSENKGQYLRINCVKNKIYQVGCILTGIFAQNSVATIGGNASIPCGWLDG
jgi:hypothetical protein